MRGTSLLLASTLAVSSLLSIAAHAPAPADCRETGVHAEGEQARLLCSQANYFLCDGTTKVHNIDLLVSGKAPSWNTTAPYQSVQSGAGCGLYESSLTNGTNPKNGQDGVWEGTFTGNLESFTVEIHKIDNGLSRVDDTENALLWVQIDGNDVVARQTTGTVLIGERSSTQASVKYLFTVKGIKGMNNELGSGTKKRTITIGVRSYADYQGAWVWGTTEVPSGVTFNPTSNKGTVVNAD